jgi:PAS domain S-box-containing protein
MDSLKLRTFDAALAETIIDGALPPFVICDAHGRVAMQSPAFVKTFGADRAALDLASRCAEAKTESEARPFVPSLFTGGNGRTYRLQAATLGKGNGAARSFIISFIDVTPHAQRLRDATEQSQRWSDLVEIASDWRWVVDADGKVTEVSERFALFSGLPAPLARGRKLTELGRLIDPPAGDFAGLAGVAARRAIADVVMAITHPDGKTTHHRLSGVPVFSETTGQFIGYRGLARDVSEQYEAEAALIASRNELQQAMSALRRKNAELVQALEEAAAGGRARSEFLANVSHELRTPLNAIIGFAEVMREEIFGPVGNPKYRDYVSDIHMSATHLHALISDILDFSTLDAGRREIHFENCDLAEEIAYCVRLIQAAAQKKRIEITLEGTLLPCVIEADRRSLRQILTNLLTNAVKFTRETGQVAVSLAHGGKDVTVTIADNGVGIAEEDLKRITQPFMRGGNEYARRQDGTGLGLALTKSLIELHQGKLHIDSEQGRGTRVSVTLPRTGRAG